MKTSHLSVALLLALLAGNVFAEAVKDRDGAVRADRLSIKSRERWMYNDVESGFAEAKRTGKPVLVVLRCVPCLACMGLDAKVLEEPQLSPLLDKFVCVRVINANTLDLTRFQFDFDLSFSTLFFNADGTIYGRFGSWKHQKDPKEASTAGYKRALEAALAIHAGYPANKAALAGKQPEPLPFKSSLEIPGLAEKYKRDLDWDGKLAQSCVHCHMVSGAMRASLRDQKKPLPPELIYPQPQPETIGLTLAPDHVARVESVAAGSVAEKAGFKTGDDIVGVQGQPLVSPADFSWALHRAPDSATLSFKVKRSAAEQTLAAQLPQGWRSKTDISGRVGVWSMRGMVTGGLKLVDLASEDRTKLGIADDALALRVEVVGMYGKNAAAKNAGFQKDDVIVELDGKKSRETEGELIGRLLQTKMPGEKVRTTVLRGTDRHELTLPMQ